MWKKLKLILSNATGELINPATEDTQLVVKAAVEHLDTQVGSQTDADTANTLIGRIKRLVSLQAGGLPSVLSNDRLKVENQHSQPLTATQLSAEGVGKEATLLLLKLALEHLDTQVGSQTDADTANTLIGRIKRLVSLQAGGLPSALSNDRLKVENQHAQPLTAAQLSAEGLGKDATLIQVRDKIEDIKGYTDTLEALIGATNGLLADLKTYTDGVEGQLATLIGKDFATEVSLAKRHNDFASLLKYEPQIGKKLRRAVNVENAESQGEWVGLKSDYHLRAPLGTANNATSWEAVRFYKNALGQVVLTTYLATGVRADQPQNAAWTE